MASKYNCITCKHRQRNPNDDDWCDVLEDWICFTEEDFTEKVGCASHSSMNDIQNNERVLLTGEMLLFCGEMIPAPIPENEEKRKTLFKIIKKLEELRNGDKS